MKCIFLEKNQLYDGDSFGIHVQRRVYQTTLLCHFYPNTLAIICTLHSAAFNTATSSLDVDTKKYNAIMKNNEIYELINMATK